MRTPWQRLLQQTLGFLLIAALVGTLLGQLFLLLWLTTLACLGWHLLHLYRLERWLGQKSEPHALHPDSIWDLIYRRSIRLRQHSASRKRKLSQWRNLFQQGAAAFPDAVIVIDKADKILWCNNSAENLLGLRTRQDYNQPITALLRHPDFVAFLHKRCFTRSVEVPSPVANDRMISLRLVHFRKKRFLLLATDITRLHRLEQTRRDFVANASHELRTPLTVIGGYLETLQYCGDECAEKWRGPLQQMHQQTTRMTQIIEDLLTLSRLENEPAPRHQEPVNVPHMLKAIAEYTHTLSNKQDLRLAIEADETLWLLGNEQELHSAFSNLVLNAVRYSPNDKTITIRWYSDERGAHLEVEDQGIGIAPHHIPRITERFYRGDRSRQRENGGTGLGLAIVKHVLSRHQGQLRVTSELGVGSTFSCDFPAAIQSIKKPSAASFNAPHADQHSNAFQV